MPVLHLTFATPLTINCHGEYLVILIPQYYDRVVECVDSVKAVMLTRGHVNDLMKLPQLVRVLHEREIRVIAPFDEINGITDPIRGLLTIVPHVERSSDLGEALRHGSVSLYPWVTGNLDTLVELREVFVHMLPPPRPRRGFNVTYSVIPIKAGNVYLVWY